LGIGDWGFHSALRLTTLAAIAPLFYGRALAKLGRIGSFKLLRTLTRRCRFSRRPRQEYARLKPSG